jgi:hypothetical protein
VRDALEHIGRPDVRVAVVTFGSSDLLGAYRRHLDISFPVLSDRELHAYEAYGLGRGPLWRIYRPATIKKYVQLVRSGKKLRRPTEDTRQLGGDFVIGMDGTVRFAHRPVAPDDRPPVTDIIAALEPREDRAG